MAAWQSCSGRATSGAVPSSSSLLSCHAAPPPPPSPRGATGRRADLPPPPSPLHRSGAPVSGGHVALYLWWHGPAVGASCARRSPCSGVSCARCGPCGWWRSTNHGGRRRRPIEQAPARASPPPARASPPPARALPPALSSAAATEIRCSYCTCSNCHAPQHCVSSVPRCIMVDWFTVPGAAFFTLHQYWRIPFRVLYRTRCRQSDDGKSYKRKPRDQTTRDCCPWIPRKF